MKKILSLLILLLGSLAAAAQDYAPTTTWPYLYPEFRQGTICLLDGTTFVQELNVHLRRGRLHYLDKGGIVKDAVLTEVMMALIGEDRFLNVGGQMMRIEAEGRSKGYVAAQVLADYSALGETGGAYGTSSSTSATRKMSSIETDTQINQSYMLLQQERGNGQMLPVRTKYYLVTPGLRVPATRKDVEAVLPEGRKEAWKAFQKAEKIKWNKPASLVAVADFLTE